jgi:hypothetical protein
MKPYTYSLKLWYTCGFATPLLISIIDTVVDTRGMFVTSLAIGLALALAYTTPFCIGLLPIIWLLNRLRLSVTTVKIIITALALIYTWFMIFHSKRDLLVIMDPKTFVIPLSFVSVLTICIWSYQLKESNSYEPTMNVKRQAE